MWWEIIAQQLLPSPTLLYWEFFSERVFTGHGGSWNKEKVRPALARVVTMGWSDAQARRSRSLVIRELPETAEDSVKWMEWRSDNTAMEKKLTWAGNDDDEGCGSVRLFAWLPRKTQRYNWRNYVAINKTRDITRELAFIIQWIIFYRFLEVIKTYRVFSLLIAHSKCTVYKTLQDFLFCWKIFIWNSPSLYFS